jgi:WD40 repeat protein
VRIWDLQEGRERAKIEAQPWVHAVTMSPDDQTLALGHLDGSVSLWDLPGLREKTRIRRDLEQVSAVAWSPDGKSLAWGDVAGSVVWAEGSAGIDPLQYRPRRPREIRDLSFSQDGRTLVAVDDGGLSWAYSGVLGREPVFMPAGIPGSPPDHRWNASGFLQKRGSSVIGSEVFSSDGSIAVTMTKAGTILIWQAPGAK